jgi:serine/threonine protein kinase
VIFFAVCKPVSCNCKVWALIGGGVGEQMKECLRSDQRVIIWKACRIDEDGEPTNETYTLKRFPVMEADPRRQLIAELDGLQEMPAHLAVQPVDAFVDKLECVLVLDNEGGNYLSESVANKGAMPERLVSIVVRQVLTALLYLQNEKMRVHNDICAANLLVLRSGEVKLGGFAFSSKAFMGRTSCRFAGNYAHMSPERLLGLECGYKADVWSVGILTLDLIIGACPFDMKRFVGPTAIFDFKRTVVEEPSPSLRRGGE